ncbi:hypothetical protein BXO88_14545 [Oribacterium sp. C9]|uniref:hypothetical protein n=1 Tax=Oribacterium sp. C9 TaxID=1943579 RepID=UPI00098FA059|nr:hypothetical protein [Oribacterium sp. C9]OON85003.1 hypothetical protein BXO88_14545 [Oribacterium sp. C9]
MNPEIHLFIIWEKGRIQEEKILTDMFSRFKVLGLYKVTWPGDSFSKNLTRFYGQNLPSSSQKIQHCGDGEFILVIIQDESPMYKYRKTTKGVRKVNINIFDAKELYRYWTGGGHRIHGTNSIKEVDHDLTLLLGVNSKDFLASINQSKLPTSIQDAILSDRPITGACGWDNISQLLYALKNCTDYLILRNFEGFPKNITFGEHGDIDVLGENEKQLQLILNSTKVFSQGYRVRHKTMVDGQEVYFDFRFVGDGYYDEQWELDMLDHRELINDLFYAPDSENYAYSLLYHALIHKSKISPDYVERLRKYECLSDIYDNGKIDLHKAADKLKNFLSFKGYKITEPSDFSVYFNTSFVSTEESTYHKYRRAFYTGKNRLMRIVGE